MARDRSHLPLRNLTTRVWPQDPAFKCNMAFRCKGISREEK